MKVRDWLPWLVLGGVAYGAYRLYKSGALDPTSPNNLAYGAANRATQIATGNPNDTVGSWFYNLTHPGSGASGSQVDRILTFPDGSRHAVNLQTVAADGTFDYNGASYWMSPDRQAVPV